MKGIVQFKGNTLPDFLIASDGADNSEYSHGAGEGFGVLSYRGKVWRLKHKGEERVLTRGGEPISKLNIVMLRANKNYSKVYYAKKFNEGDDAHPDCASANGLTPDSNVERPQSKTCEVCPMNAWGSRITDDGRKGKACQDSRRMAVLITDPTLDISTDEPVLMRVPPASLGDLKTFADGMAKSNIPLWKIITQVGFNLEVAYPKLEFKAFGWDADAVEGWRELRDGSTVQRILDSAESSAPTSAPTGAVRAPTVDASEEGEDDDEVADAPPAPTSKAPETPPSKPKKPAAKKPKEPEPEGNPDDDVINVADEDTDSLVSKLLGEI